MCNERPCGGYNNCVDQYWLMAPHRLYRLFSPRAILLHLLVYHGNYLMAEHMHKDLG